VSDPDKHPKQAAAIPIRRATGGGIEICLIRRKTSSKWGIPKGYIEGGDASGAALEEAYEEAGLHGRIVGDSVGIYEYKKELAALTVAVFVMEVLDEQRTWPEMRWRERRWCSLEEAVDLLAKHKVAPLFEMVRSTLRDVLG
jgi:8-oxo-dGTP pyrophosphatase MutT (NUDIX family)